MISLDAIADLVVPVVDGEGLAPAALSFDGVVASDAGTGEGREV